MQPNLNVITAYLKKENIDIDIPEFIFQAETHPDFPSLYALSDTLSFFNINNLAARVDQEQLPFLPDKFVALLKSHEHNSFLSFVERRNDGFLYTKDSLKISVDNEVFAEMWQNIILIIDQNKEPVSSNLRERSSLPLLIPLFSFLFAGGVLLHLNAWPIPAILMLLGFIGSYLTIEILKQTFGLKSSLASAVCNGKSSSLSNCDAVINSSIFFLFKALNLSDLCVLYFLGHLLDYYIMSLSSNFQSYLSYSIIPALLCVPVIIYSIYYQWRIEKKWCTICLFIIGVICLQSIVFYAYGSVKELRFNIFSAITYLTGFIVSSLLWFSVKQKIKTYFNLKSKELKSIRFKRNYSLFKIALKDSKQHDYKSLYSPIYLGNPNANLKLSLVTNPFCGHCALMHKQLKEILKRYDNSITVNIRFNLPVKEKQDRSDLLHFRLAEIYFQDGQNAFTAALDAWFSDNNNMENWFSEFGEGKVDNEFKELLKTQFEQNADNELLFTPALIIGEFAYPNIYDRGDLIYFISELSDDQDFFIHAKNMTESELLVN